MKVIANDKDNRTLAVQMSRDEWQALLQAEGVPYDKRDSVTQCGVNAVTKAMESLWQMKELRKALAELQKKYDKIANAIDAVLEK